MEDILQIHQHQLMEYGGQDGIRDLGALESALAMPQSGLGDQYFHATLFDMAAAYLFHLVQNHPFVDGNKRVGLAAAMYFLHLSGVEVIAENKALLELTMGVASGKMDKKHVAAFFRKHGK